MEAGTIEISRPTDNIVLHLVVETATVDITEMNHITEAPEAKEVAIIDYLQLIGEITSAIIIRVAIDCMLKQIEDMRKLIELLHITPSKEPTQDRILR